MRQHGWKLLLFLLAGVLEAGCHRSRAHFIPPPAPRAAQTARPAEAPDQLPQPPIIDPEPVQPAAPWPSASAELPPPPLAQPPARPRRGPGDNRAQTPAAEAPAPVPTAPEPLRLGTMTTKEQERELNAQIDQAISGAEASLRAMGSHNLNREEEAAVAQVRSFVRQAMEARKTDPSAARSLAQRADILARDLLKNAR